MPYQPRQVFVSVDIEADGPIPGPFSMLSLGAVAFDVSGQELGRFSVNLELLAGAGQDPDTMEWWKRYQPQYDVTRENVESPVEGMKRFVVWAEAFEAELVFVAYPAAYDFMWAYWYMLRYVGRSPFSFSGLDIKTLGMAVTGLRFKEVTKKSMRRFLPADRHTHVAEEDALEQGRLFFNLDVRAAAQRAAYLAGAAP